MEGSNKMPVFIFEPNALSKMCQVEGAEYGTPGIQEALGDCSFSAFKKRWEEVVAQNPELKNVADKYGGISVNKENAIYGWGGYHRYLVRYSGEIIFLEQFVAPPEMKQMIISLVKRLGFRTQ
ncbi:MAG: hypothetical protein PHD51_03380 [Patescibacteria group bacterium]|nr:hypothetical protein [Patescibacteria group bacterium]MDD5490981.1 hypothetical protein [Patescibacteria group bacterium]